MRERAPRLPTLFRPIGNRCFVVAALAAWLVTSPRNACAEDNLRLDRNAVITLARERFPDVEVANARVGEARALRIGAGAAAQVNPELRVSAGPRFLPMSQINVDVIASLLWPVDISGSRRLRVSLADEKTRLAEAETTLVTLSAIGQAVDLWLRALGAADTVRMEADRLRLDDALVRVARARRDTGAAGDGDVALAIVVQVEGQARLHIAEGERDALIEQLRGLLGIEQGITINLVEDRSEVEAPHLPSLLAQLKDRPAFKQRAAVLRSAVADAALQKRLRIPMLSLLAEGGRSPETYVMGGIGAALPVYQRNQTNAAVAAARVTTGEVEVSGLGRRAEAELRSAYASYMGRRAAYAALENGAPAMADAEHLATRGYELGEGTLASVITVRREVASARLALNDARWALSRARLALDLTAGVIR